MIITYHLHTIDIIHNTTTNNNDNTNEAPTTPATPHSRRCEIYSYYIEYKTNYTQHMYIICRVSIYIYIYIYIGI